MQLNYRDILSMPEEKALLVINHSLSENLRHTYIVIGKNLKVIYHPLYGMNNYVLTGVIGYHVTLSEGHMIANHPI